MKEPRVIGLPTMFGWLLKAAAWLLILAIPLLGAWVASSIAAYRNLDGRLVAAVGFLLFPILPALWEFVAELRRKKPSTLTFLDRLLLRTFTLNVLFLAVLLGTQPKTGFVALAARGDWFLLDKTDPGSEKLRRHLFAAASRLEWLYRQAHDNPFREFRSKDKPPPPPPKKDEAPAKKTETTQKVETTPKVDEPEKPRALWPQPEALHPLVTSMPPSAELTIASVAQYISAHEPDPLLRLKALHDYVADRIVYDAPALALPHIPREDGDPQAVFERRKGVCAGYARLLEELGKASGLDVRYVTGDVRNRQGSTVNGIGHAWNVAHVGETWVLLDPTWNAGHLENNEFKKAYRTAYLFTPPEIFGLDHFPDEKWEQLRETPLELGEWLRLPMLRPDFFALGLTLRTPNRSQVTVGEELDVIVENPRGVWIWLQRADKGADRSIPCAEPSTQSTLHCRFPQRGNFDVRFFLNSSKSGSFTFAGQLEVNRP